MGFSLSISVRQDLLAKKIKLLLLRVNNCDGLVFVKAHRTAFYNRDVNGVVPLSFR